MRELRGFGRDHAQGDRLRRRHLRRRWHSPRAADQGRCACGAAGVLKATSTTTIPSTRAPPAHSLPLAGKAAARKHLDISRGDVFTPEQSENRDHGRAIDVFIDVGSHACRRSRRGRRFKGLPASFAPRTASIYPPHAVTRCALIASLRDHRTLKKSMRTAAELRAVHVASSIPAFEITVICNGCFCKIPIRPSRKTSPARSPCSIDATDKQRERIAAIFDGAEKLFFDCWHPEARTGRSEDSPTASSHLHLVEEAPEPRGPASCFSSACSRRPASRVPDRVLRQRGQKKIPRGMKRSSEPHPRGRSRASDGGHRLNRALRRERARRHRPRGKGVSQ